MHYDLIVIGSGPGGEGAAMTAAKAGKQVAIIERKDTVGGSCTHTATIPSKALREVLSEVRHFKRSPLFADAALSQKYSFEDYLQIAGKVIANQAKVRRGFYDRNDVDVYHGHARFTDEKTIEIEAANGATITGDAFIIATGSRPYQPEGVDFAHARVHDSDSILRLNGTARSITIYGAGVIGCEYASMLRNLDLKVNLVNTREHLLDFLDDEITDALSYHMREQGIIIRHNETIEKLEPLTDGVVLHLKSGKKFKTDIFLWANGRTGNTSNLGLDKIGLEANNRGQIAVNEHLQTAKEHIYAVGDVKGSPSLASTAYDEGRYAAAHLTFGKAESELLKNMPTGIYTSPEISSLGPTEQELTAQKVPYEVGHALFRSLARAQIVGETAGMLKILFHRETLEILSIHCFGYQAAEIIHIGQAIMSQPGKNNTIRYFTDTTFNYPTMAEAYRVAALNGLNRIF